jgi:predicted ATP-dependent endonuclease of OLD family
MSEYSVTMVFGRSELKQFNRFENGRMVTYSYRVDYDHNGAETGRTEPEPLGSVGWANGAPFTKADYRALSA